MLPCYGEVVVVPCLRKSVGGVAAKGQPDVLRTEARLVRAPKPPYAAVLVDAYVAPKPPVTG